MVYRIALLKSSLTQRTLTNKAVSGYTDTFSPQTHNTHVSTLVPSISAKASNSTRSSRNTGASHPFPKSHTQATAVTISVLPLAYVPPTSFLCAQTVVSNLTCINSPHKNKKSRLNSHTGPHLQVSGKRILINKLNYCSTTPSHSRSLYGPALPRTSRCKLDR